MRRFISSVLSNAKYDTTNMAANDHAADPEYFTFVAPGLIGIRRLVAVMEVDVGVINRVTNFGSGAPLEVGLHIEVVGDGETQHALTVTALGGINDNGDLDHFFIDERRGWGTGHVVWIWELKDGDYGVELQEGWELRALVHDDLTSRCDNFHIHFQAISADVDYPLPPPLPGV